MYKISWRVTIGKYKLGLLDSLSVHSSVELLADTATIKLPAQMLNKAFEVEQKLKRGDAVTIECGYDDDLKTEFKGFINAIKSNAGSVILECEDAIYLTRKPLPNKTLNTTTIRALLQEVVNVMGAGYTAETNYERGWDKFVFNEATGYDVLKKIQEECSLNIYIKDKKLIAEPRDIFNSNKIVNYDFAKNIEKSDLTYRRADEKDFEVTVEGITKDGKRKSVKVGTPGGDKRKIIVSGILDEAALIKRGNEEMKLLQYDGYEGSITAWAIPFIESGYGVRLHDADYEYKNGTYFAVSVTTDVGAGGIVRKIQLGRKI
jgi:hypothetical protein